jgi:TPR repeat protein
MPKTASNTDPDARSSPGYDYHGDSGPMRSIMPSGPCMEVSMKRRWAIVGISSMALICAGILVRTERKNRQLAKRAAAYRILAEQGDAKSQLALGGMYYYGKGVPKNYVEAARWYLKSAEQGNVNAQYSIASMYTVGKDCRRTILRGLAGAEELPNKATLLLSTALASSIAEDKEWHRTMQRLSAGTANLPIKVIRRLNTR